MKIAVTNIDNIVKQPDVQRPCRSSPFPRQDTEPICAQVEGLFCAEDWPLEPSWKFGDRASTWGEAVGESLTTWWLRRLAAGEVRSAKLKIFLQWAQEQRDSEASQQRLQSGQGSSSSNSSVDDRAQLSVPPCIICLEARPTQLCAPCHHFCLCEACSLQLFHEDNVRCPVCRGPVESFIKAFY